MITAAELSKSYSGSPVVRDVSFTCAPGTITGFLGPNGAGKSTTLRMITGLTRPDRGCAHITGLPFARLPNPARVVGTLLDPSAVHPGRTGRETLAVAAQLADVPTGRVDQLLKHVGLAGAGRRRVGAYSLGMRQRLGIAHALIGSPAVLVLDEPANGLDPEGIAWLRRLLREFADHGGAVLLSSHLLSEVQASVDHLVVISAGRVVATGPISQLLASSSGLIVRSPSPGALADVLARAGIPFSRSDDGSLLIDTSTGADATTIAELALTQRLLITELRPANTGGLEDLFFSLTNPTEEHA